MLQSHDCDREGAKRSTPAMNVLSCTQAHSHLIQALRSDQANLLAPDACEHLEVCPICQTALLMISALALPTTPKPIDCASCLEALAGFVEYEGELRWL